MDEESKPPPAAGSGGVVVEKPPKPDPLSEPAPSWFTPKRLLVIFCVINLVNYVDHGAIASKGVNGTPRACTQTGVCSRGTGIHFNPFRLIGVGLSVWTFAAAGCGISVDFWSITACRMRVNLTPTS